MLAKTNLTRLSCARLIIPSTVARRSLIARISPIGIGAEATQMGFLWTTFRPLDTRRAPKFCTQQNHQHTDQGRNLKSSTKPHSVPVSLSQNYMSPASSAVGASYIEWS